jgi:branched-chain amino acid transport system substrate-binding protein
MDKFIGVWWSGSEQDVIPAGVAATGYKSGAFHAAGSDFSVHEDVVKFLYDKGKGTAEKRSEIGTVLYNRGLINAVITTEAIRTAQGKYGNKPLTGEEVRWGFENLSLTNERLTELGLEGFMNPISVSCADHEGSGPVRIQQWDGQKWTFITDWIEPMREVVRPMIEASAAKYAEEKSIVPRECP